MPIETTETSYPYPTRRRFLALGLGLLCASSGALPSLAAPQDETVEFESFLRLESERLGVSIVVEGRPFVSRLSVADSRALRVAIAGESPATRFRRLADAFDYDCLAISPTVFGFRKRFSDPRDFPDLTLETSVSRIRLACDLWRRETGVEIVAFPEEREHPLVSFLASASESDLDALKENVALSDLPEPLRQTLRAILLYDLAEPLRWMKRVEQLLEISQEPGSAFARVRLTPDAPWVTVLEGPFRLNRRCQLAISHGFRIDPQGFATVRTPDRDLMIRFAFDFIPSEKVGRQLAQILGALENPDPGPPAAPSPALQTTRLSGALPSVIFEQGAGAILGHVFGTPNPRSPEIRKAISTVFSVDVFERDGSLRIGPPRPAATKLSTLTDSLAQILSPSLARYLTARQADALAAIRSRAKTDPPEKGAIVSDFRNRSLARETAKEAAYKAFALELRREIEPRLKHDGRLPVTESETRVHSRLASLLLSDGLFSFLDNGLLDAKREWLDRLETIAVQMTASSDRRCVGYSFHDGKNGVHGRALSLLESPRKL